MTTGQTVARVLDETIDALATLDLDKLCGLEERATALAQSRLAADDTAIHSIQAKKRVLEQLLRRSESNLSTLCRLHERNTGDAWVR